MTTLYLDIFSCFSPQVLLIFAFCVLTSSANSEKPMVSEPWYVVHMLAYALELNTTICRIAYSIWLGARRITRIGLKIVG